MKKYLTVGVLALILFLGFYFVAHQSKNSKSLSGETKILETSPQKAGPAEALPSDNQSAMDRGVNNDALPVVVKSSPYPEPSYDDIAFLEGLPTSEQRKAGAEYSEERGWISEEVSQAYENYPTEELEELANTGDLAAIDVLALRYSASGKPDEMNATWRKGVVYGASSHAVALAGGYVAKYGSTFGSPEEKTESVIEGLAWYNIAIIRRDPYAEGFLEDDIKHLNLDLTAFSQDKVDQRTAEIYKALSEEREGLGLGAYDNDVPENLEEYLYDTSGKWSKEYRQQ